MLLFRPCIIDLMASTWRRDNRAPFPVKEKKKKGSHCGCHWHIWFSGRCKQKHISGYNTTYVLRLIPQSFDRLYFGYVQINNGVLPVGVITGESCHHHKFDYLDEAYRFFSCWVLNFLFNFPFHFLLIWKAKLVTDVDDSRDVRRQNLLLSRKGNSAARCPIEW